MGVIRVLPGVLLAACASSAPAKEASAPVTGAECRIVIPSRASSPERLPPVTSAPAARASRIVVHAETPLSSIKQELEAKIERRLANVRGASIGFAGTANYTVDRGPFGVSVEDDALVVRTVVRADVEACSRGRCYASCTPAAVVRAFVPLKLLPDYRFARSRVTVTFTRGCKIRALGGFVTIDVTRQLEAEIEPILRRVERDVDRQLPDLEPEAERLWAELSSSRRVPLVGCVVLQPRGIVQGPPVATADILRLRFALQAAPELRSECGDTGPGAALPRLAQDPALPEEDEVMLGLVSPLADVASALEAIEPIDAGGTLVRIQRAAVESAGNAIDVDLSVAGNACGEVAVRASPAWSRDGRALSLTLPDLSRGEMDRIAAASMDPTRLATMLVSAPRIRVLLDVDRVDDVLPTLASSLSDDSVDVAATVSAVRPAHAAARDKDLVAWLGIRGKLVLRQK